MVELFGHQKETGFVSTEYFGDKAMFQIDVPDMPEREVTTKRPGYVDGQWAPVGTVLKKSAIPSRSRLVSPGAVYAMNPCTEEFARAVIDEESRVIALISLPAASADRTLMPGEEDQGTEDGSDTDDFD